MSSTEAIQQPASAPVLANVACLRGLGELGEPLQAIHREVIGDIRLVESVPSVSPTADFNDDEQYAVEAVEQLRFVAAALATAIDACLVPDRPASQSDRTF